MIVAKEKVKPLETKNVVLSKMVIQIKNLAQRTREVEIIVK